ncbi:MAG: tol-pal system protein YbgF [Devosia sp. 66-22]|nr:MAG: tol-pal system protein YbgF [Devosia sp. 66-22]
MIVHLSLARWKLRGGVALAAVLTAAIFAPIFVQAQSRNEAQLAVQIQDLQDQVRTLTGQVDGLQFSIGQMQTQLQQMADDNEFRFQQLEGGGAGKTEAAPQSGGVTPPAEAPQPDTGTQATPDAAPADTTALPDPNAAPSGDAQPGVSGSLTEAPAGAGDVPVTNDEPMDDLGDSADPLLGQGQPGGATTGTLGGTNGVPLNLSLDGGQTLEDGDAKAQYAAGYDAIVRGDYAFAEEQFRQFVALYPQDPQAPDATNWLGEALLQRQAYDEAADVLLTGFQAYERSARAPDLLLKLGIALAGAGEVDTACRTYFEVSKRFPNQPAAFNQRLQEERQKAHCPA